MRFDIGDSAASKQFILLLCLSMSLRLYSFKLGIFIHDRGLVLLGFQVFSLHQLFCTFVFYPGKKQVTQCYGNIVTIYRT